jgi:hypothetical protein
MVPAKVAHLRDARMLRMKPDLYTKAVLTGILILLALIAFKMPRHSDNSALNTQSIQVPVADQSKIPLNNDPFAHIRPSADNGGLYFFDTKTGEIYYYHIFTNTSGVDLSWKYRLVEPGKPLVKEK